MLNGKLKCGLSYPTPKPLLTFKLLVYNNVKPRMIQNDVIYLYNIVFNIQINLRLSACVSWVLEI